MIIELSLPLNEVVRTTDRHVIDAFMNNAESFVFSVNEDSTHLILSEVEEYENNTETEIDESEMGVRDPLGARANCS